MRPVEDFKTSTATDEWQGTNKHDHQNGYQQEASWIGPSADQPEEAWSRREQELVEREVLCVDHRIVHSIAGEVNNMHYGMYTSECDDKPSSQLVQINVLIEWQDCS